MVHVIRACGVRRLASLAVLCASATATQAQSTADIERDAAQQRRASEREAAQAQRLQPSADVHLKGPAARPDRPLPADEKPCFPIRSVTIEGWPFRTLPALARALSGPNGDDAPEGRCLGAQGVDVLLQRVQNELVAEGYITTRVLAQPQNLSDGALVLSVIPGRIRGLVIEGGEAASPGLRAALPAAPGDLLNLRDIEQALENLKRVPTVDADIEIRPGAQPGESDLVVKLQRARPLRLQASLDDSGSKSTGRYQAGVTFSFDNPLGLNDLFYVGFTGGFLDKGQQGTEGQTAHYSLPYGYWLLGLSASSNRYHQRVAGLTQDYTYRGDSASTELKLSRLVHRDATRKTTLSAKLFQRQSHNFIDDTEVEVQHRSVGGWEAALSHRAAWGSTSLDLNLAYKRGTGAFHALPSPEQEFGEGTSRFGLVTADATLGGAFSWAGREWRYSSAWRAQFNRTPLTPQDRFAIGGRYTVRGFDGERSLSADHGWTWRNELGSPVLQPGIEAYLGLDVGAVGGPSGSHLAGHSLAGAVLGLRGGLPSRLQFDLTLGRGLHAPAGFATSSLVTTFSLMQSW